MEAHAWLDVRTPAAAGAQAASIFTGSNVVHPPAPALHLSPAFLMLLFGDGSPSRVFDLLTGSRLVPRVIAHDIECGALAATPVAASSGDPDHLLASSVSPVDAAIAALGAPRLRRSVWLENAAGARLGYAVSWWREADAATHLPPSGVPIGATLVATRMGTTRELLCVACARAGTELAEGLGVSPGAEVWARWYRLWLDEHRALAIVYEVFAPDGLARWLGAGGSSGGF